MDATTIGALLLGVGGVASALVAYLGKRGENAITGYGSLTGHLQAERDRLDRLVGDKESKIVELSAMHAADQAEIARLRDTIARLGGNPS